MLVKKILPAVCMSMLFTQPLFADDEGGEDGAVEYRQSIMTLMQDNYKPMKAMVNGKMRMNKRLFTGMAKDLSRVAQLNLVRGFPQGSMGEDSDAKPEIWKNQRDFASKLDELREAATELRKAANGDNISEIRMRLDAVGRACKSCHDDYKKD